MMKEARRKSRGVKKRSAKALPGPRIPTQKNAWLMKQGWLCRIFDSCTNSRLITGEGKQEMKTGSCIQK